AAGAGWWRGNDRVTVVLALQRLQPLRVVGGEILHAEDAAVGLAGFHDGLGDRSFIERVSAALGDLLQRVGEVRLHQSVAGLPRLAAVADTAADSGYLLSASRSLLMIFASPSSSTKPSRASLIAGWMTCATLIVPYFLSAVSRPITVPGTPTLR